MKANHQRITSSKFIVWTQAGFNQACEIVKEGYDLTIFGYPKVYPSYVRFIAGYEGYHFLSAECVPLSNAIDDLKREMETLIEADRRHNETNN